MRAFLGLAFVVAVLFAPLILVRGFFGLPILQGAAAFALVWAIAWLIDHYESPRV